MGSSGSAVAGGAPRLLSGFTEVPAYPPAVGMEIKVVGLPTEKVKELERRRLDQRGKNIRQIPSYIGTTHFRDNISEFRSIMNINNPQTNSRPIAIFTSIISSCTLPMS